MRAPARPAHLPSAGQRLRRRGAHGSGGRAYAFSLSCPHRGATIRWEGSGAFCPKHKARFSAEGENVGGRQTRALDRYAIRRLGMSVAVDTTAPLEQVANAAAWVSVV